MIAGLEEVRKNVKDFLYFEGRRNVKVIDPTVDIRGLKDGQTWEDDPIHLTSAAYFKLADGVTKMSSGGSGGASMGRGGAGGRDVRGRGAGRGFDHNNSWRKRGRTDSMETAGGDSRRHRSWGPEYGEGARRGQRKLGGERRRRCCQRKRFLRSWKRHWRHALLGGRL
jgi:hypothetical protein